MTAQQPHRAPNTTGSVPGDSPDPYRATQGEKVPYRKGDIVRITVGGETAKCKILGVVPDPRNSLGFNFEFERLTPWEPANPSTEETAP